MGCSHAATCPLFPLLRASLQGWRNYYCDSEDRWLDCARYELSLTGERVPISLLPNGAVARHLERQADAGRPGPADPGQATRQVPPPHSPAPFETPAPARLHQPPPPAQISQPVDSPAEHGQGHGHRRRASSPKRGWWARLADWMRNPA